MEIIGLIMNFFGAIILTFSTGSFFKWIVFSINSHEIFVETFTSGGDIAAITGTTVHLADSFKKAKIWMIIGVFFIIIGFGLQLLAHLLQL